MKINKPLIQIIKENDINFIEKNEIKNKKNNKNKKVNIISSDIDENDIIENYAYEIYEEEKNYEIKKNNEIETVAKENNEKNRSDNLISDIEPLPEIESEIEILNHKINKTNEKKNNDLDVIDFDDDNIAVTVNKNEKIDNNLNKSKNNTDILNKSNKKNNNINKNELLEPKKEIKKESINILNNNEKNNGNFPKKENIINYSLDQEEIMDILDLNKKGKKIEKEKENKANDINEDDLSKIFLNKNSEKKLLKDLYEKEMKFKNAYAEYYTKLSETMNNNYFKDMIENSTNKNIFKEANQMSNKDFLIHQQTNTINDINIFCLNNSNNNNNNYVNFNAPKSQTFEIKNNYNINDFRKNNSDNHLFNSQNINIGNAYEEYKNSKLDKYQINNNDYARHPTIILSIRKFLNEYNISVQTRSLVESDKNPLLNYETYIDILNDLNYISQNNLAQIYFINTSIYKELWKFLININNNENIFDNEEHILESNVLLMFLLVLNGFFNNKKMIEELEIELKWLKFENYEILIMKSEYIENNFSELIGIRRKNILMKFNYENNLFIINNQKKYISENNSNPEDILSEYFNSYTSKNLNNIYNPVLNNYNNNIKNKKIYNYSANKLDEKNHYKQKKISSNINNNKQLYAFKPRNNSNVKKIDLNKEKIHSLVKNNSLGSIKVNRAVDVNKLQLDKIENIINNNEIRKEKNLKRNNIKNKILKTEKINYNEYYNLSKTKDDVNDIHINNSSFHNSIIKIPSKQNILNNISTKNKSNNYITKVKQNRTDLKKLFKNNEYKDGTINERLEKIKKHRNNSRPKGIKIQINYEEYTNFDKFKDKNNEQNQKHKFQFRKHTPQKKNIVCYNFKIENKEYTLEHNQGDNIEIEIMQFMQKNNIIGISAKSILEKIKNDYNEIK